MEDSPESLDDQDADLPEADPRNPFDLILVGGIHGGKCLRMNSMRNALLLPTNLDNEPSAPFFCEYRPTDRRHPLNGLRIWEYVGIGIDSSSMPRTPASHKALPHKPSTPGLHIHKDR